MTLALFGIAFTVSGGAACTENRIYSLVGFLADQVQLAGKTVEVRGEVSCSNELNCTITGQNHSVPFNSTNLPEADRISLLESGLDLPKRKAVVTIEVGSYSSLAQKIEFEK